MAIELLEESELASIRPLLLNLLQEEQVQSGETPMSLEALDSWLPATRSAFTGHNRIFVAREEGTVVGFCWCVLFDPGTGLEGEIAELFVLPEVRGRGVAGALVRRATELFASMEVSFACVWTRDDNPAAVRAYRRAGFAPTEQTVLTWYPGRSEK